MSVYDNKGLRALRDYVLPSVYGLKPPELLCVVGLQSHYLENRVTIKFSNGLKITTKISDLEMDPPASEG